MNSSADALQFQISCTEELEKQMLSIETRLEAAYRARLDQLEAVVKRTKSRFEHAWQSRERNQEQLKEQLKELTRENEYLGAKLRKQKLSKEFVALELNQLREENDRLVEENKGLKSLVKRLEEQPSVHEQATDAAVVTTGTGQQLQLLEMPWTTAVSSPASSTGRSTRPQSPTLLAVHTTGMDSLVTSPRSASPELQTFSLSLLEATLTTVERGSQTSPNDNNDDNNNNNNNHTFTSSDTIAENNEGPLDTDAVARAGTNDLTPKIKKRKFSKKERENDLQLRQLRTHLTEVEKVAAGRAKEIKRMKSRCTGLRCRLRDLRKLRQNQNERHQRERKELDQLREENDRLVGQRGELIVKLRRARTEVQEARATTTPRISPAGKENERRQGGGQRRSVRDGGGALLDIGRDETFAAGDDILRFSARWHRLIKAPLAIALHAIGHKNIDAGTTQLPTPQRLLWFKQIRLRSGLGSRKQSGTRARAELLRGASLFFSSGGLGGKDGKEVGQLLLLLCWEECRDDVASGRGESAGKHLEALLCSLHGVSATAPKSTVGFVGGESVCVSPALRREVRHEERISTLRKERDAAILALRAAATSAGHSLNWPGKAPGTEEDPLDVPATTTPSRTRGPGGRRSLVSVRRMPGSKGLGKDLKSPSPPRLRGLASKMRVVLRAISSPMKSKRERSTQKRSALADILTREMNNAAADEEAKRFGESEHSERVKFENTEVDVEMEMKVKAGAWSKAGETPREEESSLFRSARALQCNYTGIRVMSALFAIRFWGTNMRRGRCSPCGGEISFVRDALRALSEEMGGSGRQQDDSNHGKKHNQCGWKENWNLLVSAGGCTVLVQMLLRLLSNRVEDQVGKCMAVSETLEILFIMLEDEQLEALTVDCCGDSDFIASCVAVLEALLGRRRESSNARMPLQDWQCETAEAMSLLLQRLAFQETNVMEKYVGAIEALQLKVDPQSFVALNLASLRGRFSAQSKK